MHRHLVKDDEPDIPKTTEIKGITFTNLFSLNDKCDWINLVLFAVMPKYRAMTIEEQVTYTGRLEKSLIENNKLYKRLKKESRFKKVYLEMVEKFYDSVTDEEAEPVDYSSLDKPLQKVFYRIFIKKYQEIYKLVATILPREAALEIFSGIDEEVPNTFIKRMETKVKDKMLQVFDTIPECIEEDKEDYIVKQGILVFKNLGRGALEKIYKKIKADDLSTCREILASASGEFFLDKLDVMVHLINEKNKVKKSYGSGSKHIFLKFFGDRTVMLGLDGRAYYKDDDPIFEKIKL